MSTETATAPAAHAASKPHAKHPTARFYVIIFVWLTVLTAIEVAVATAVPEPFRIPVLIVIAVIKAALVVLYYMHLRYDSFWYWIILLVPVFYVLLLTRYLIVR